MNIEIIEFTPEYIDEANAVWNRVVRDGLAFPQLEELDRESGKAFFASQSFTGLAVDMDSGKVFGLYILHPNNVGRCGHICNCSYAVSIDARGMGIGEKLVRHSMEKGRELGFGILQFNAVVADNYRALSLYEKLGFVKLGVIPGGFHSIDGTYKDIIPHYHLL